MKRILVIGVIILIALIACGFAYTARGNAEARFDAYAATNPSFPDIIIAYRALMKNVGAPRAQDILVQIFPDNSRTHMIDHETGAFLYKTEGLSGIAQCKTYFAGGCYHGFISAVVAERGLGALAEIMGDCTSALSANQTLQCAHGVGHAMLADVAGYTQLPQALTLCQQAFAGDYKRTVNCYDGVFMENNFGAFSVPPPDRWYKASDPMYPCNIPEVLDKPGAHEYCWGMQSQATLRADAYPELEGDIVKVGAYCHSLSADDADICLEGLARQIQLQYGSDPAAIHQKCALLGGDAIVCDAHAAEATYIYGPQTAGALSVCMNVPAAQKNACYQPLFEGIAISFSATTTRLNACARDIPEDAYKIKCAAWINSADGMNF
jgi:hypothetical protein